MKKNVKNGQGGNKGLTIPPLQGSPFVILASRKVKFKLKTTQLETLLIRCPGREFEKEQLSRGSCPGRIILGGNCPGKNFMMGQLPVG